MSKTHPAIRVRFFLIANAYQKRKGNTGKNAGAAVPEISNKKEEINPGSYSVLMRRAWRINAYFKQRRILNGEPEFSGIIMGNGTATESLQSKRALKT